MTNCKTVVTFVAIAGVVAALVWLTGVLDAADYRYELRPEIRLPEYRSDAARAIDAYERLMERYMQITERRLIGFDDSLDAVRHKLDLIDGKLNELSLRLGRIEQALGIASVKPTPRKDREAVSGSRTVICDPNLPNLAPRPDQPGRTR